MALSRREFIQSGAAATAALGLGLPPAPAQTIPLQEPGVSAGPDLVLINGRIFTVDERVPRAEALAVKNGRFVAVGSSDDVRPWRHRRPRSSTPKEWS